MAFPTAVNSQITDSITQVNVKVLGDAPAIAMGNLFIATSQALSNAAHNATTAQQQAYVTAQAATTMAVSTLLTLDTATSGVATSEVLAQVNPFAASVLANATAPSPGTPEQTAHTATVAGLPQPATASDAIAVKQVEAAVDHVEKHMVASAEKWAHAAKEVMEAMAYGLVSVQQVNYQTNLDIVKQAAIAATLKQMVLNPDQLAQYRDILETIQTL